MIKIFDDTKIYVQCPAGVVTGGAELLHQLVDVLRTKGLSAFIVYFGAESHVIPEDYLKYNIFVSETIEDNEHNISVLYEQLFNQAFMSTKIQKILWWLSVDNFYICCAPYLSLFDLFQFDKHLFLNNLERRVYNLLFKRKNLFRNTISVKKLSKLDVINAYQSEYAHFFLMSNKFKNIQPLKDYINTDHFQELSFTNREDIVLYNPKKGLLFTKKIIAQSPEIKWVPLQGMSRSELVSVMKKAKLYIDFGYHPGKDRLPRECAMNGLCIITGKRGSAAFFEDISIDEQYKLDEGDIPVNSIVQTIKDVLETYPTRIDDFSFYRQTIRREQQEFKDQVCRLFMC